MPQYEVVVKILEVIEPDSVAARRSVEDRLRAGGLTRWKVVNIALPGATPVRPPKPPRPAREAFDGAPAGSGMVVAAVVLCTLWFLWVLAG